MDYLKYDGWTITFYGMPEEKEKSIPTLLCIGNGSIGVRGTIPELENYERKGIFSAGFFDRLPRPELAYNTFTPFLKSWSYEEEISKYHLEEALVNCPDILDGYFETEGERFGFDETEKEKLTRHLDMRSGEVVFHIPVVTGSGKKGTVTRKRFASMADQAAVYELCSFERENFTGRVEYHALVDTDTKNFNVSGIYQDAVKEKDYAEYRLYDVLEQERDEDNFQTVIRGRCNGYKLYMAGRTEEEDAQELSMGEELRILRRAAVICDRTSEIDKKILQGCLERISRLSYEEALEQSRKKWQKIWETCDIEIDGDLRIQTGIRHNLYLLNLSVCRTSDRVSVAAKGLTGEGYRGMVFWDTDIHMFPFFLYTQPETARNIVSFRCRTLDGAREKARKYGFKGADYPWETGTSGLEECEGFLKLITHQLHITADVAYAAGQYIEASKDEKFYVEEAAELLVETARFWLSKGHMENGEFCISQCSGPDELHLESDNNAYVMNMVRHNLLLAARAVQKLENEYPQYWEEIVRKTGLTEAEKEQIFRYKDCIKTMKGKDGLYEQCEGFFKLEDRIVYENDPYIVPADTQTVKQADTLMLLYLLPQLVNKEELMENWNYYEPRTTHTSSLSYGVHGIIAAKLGLAQKAKYYLEKSMGLDLFNPASNCADGAHLAAAGMSWSAVINGIAGVAFKDDEIEIAPFLPENWKRLKFKLEYQGRQLCFELTHKGVKIENAEGSSDAQTILCGGSSYQVGKGEQLCL